MLWIGNTHSSARHRSDCQDGDRRGAQRLGVERGAPVRKLGRAAYWNHEGDKGEREGGVVCAWQTTTKGKDTESAGSGQGQRKVSSSRRVPHLEENLAVQGGG